MLGSSCCGHSLYFEFIISPDSGNRSTDKTVDGQGAPGFIELLGISELRSRSGVIIDGDDSVHNFVLPFGVWGSSGLEHGFT